MNENTTRDRLHAAVFIRISDAASHGGDPNLVLAQGVRRRCLRDTVFRCPGSDHRPLVLRIIRCSGNPLTRIHPIYWPDGRVQTIDTAACGDSGFSFVVKPATNLVNGLCHRGVNCVTRSRIPAHRPRHVDVSDKLAEAIVSGSFSVGERFPTESDLQERFGVGRHTVREALKTLTDQGLLVRKPKVGTTVVGDKPLSQYTHLIRDIRGLLDFSGNTRLQIDYAGMMIPGDTLSDHLSDEPGAKWLRIAGIRFTREDNTPLCWSEIYVPQGFPLDRQKILAGVSPIYEYVCAEHGLKLDQVEQEISAGLMGEQAARLLETTPGSASLTVVRRYLDQGGRLFELTINTYPAARYSVKSVIRQRA